jgi:hypothetical protein
MQRFFVLVAALLAAGALALGASGAAAATHGGAATFGPLPCCVH